MATAEFQRVETALADVFTRLNVMERQVADGLHTPSHDEPYKVTPDDLEKAAARLFVVQKFCPPGTAEEIMEA
jgi:hypothetical protein